MIPTLPPIPEYIIAIIMLFIVPLAGWLNDNKFPTWVNAFISGVIILIFAFVCAFATHSLSSDLWLSFWAIGGFTSALVFGIFAPLRKWLMLRAPSPLGFLAPGQSTAQVPVARRQPSDYYRDER